ncbi:MAG: HNH endonuclease [Candidatus Caenarcaniphilales bacterium]|nr:HNH endonuclease [Candidatus Caenarcaniphilales bacterium]
MKRINPDTQTTLRLYADSAGYCQNPNCNEKLFSETNQTNFNIAERAHIYAASDSGPRPNQALTPEERSDYNNLILLCPNCHTKIDKAPRDYPDSLIKEWKTNHIDNISKIFNITKFENREKARLFIEPILRQNKFIHQEYGPQNEYRENPESEKAEIWKRKMINQIIPNNSKLLNAFDQNTSLLTSAELYAMEAFRQHNEDLIHRHLGDNTTIASMFPEEINGIFS